MELRVLLLKSFHASIEMHLQPLPAMDGEKLHALRNISTFIYASNDVSKGIFAASPEVRFPTGSTIVVGNIASAETKLAHAIVYGCFLESIGFLLLKKHWPDNLFHKLAPKLRTLFLRLVKGNLLGHAW